MFATNNKEFIYFTPYQLLNRTIKIKISTGNDVELIQSNLVRSPIFSEGETLAELKNQLSVKQLAKILYNMKTFFNTNKKYLSLPIFYNDTELSKSEINNLPELPLINLVVDNPKKLNKVHITTKLFTRNINGTFILPRTSILEIKIHLYTDTQTYIREIIFMSRNIYFSNKNLTRVYFFDPS